MLGRLRLLVRSAAVRLGYHSRPSFLIIGAQKAGTTALHRFLGRHPDIAPAWDKEIHYFDQDVSLGRGASWYHSRFPLPSGRPVLTFEATPEYLFDPRCAARIHAYDSRLRLIVTLRNPVDRAYSYWNMARNVHGRGYKVEQRRPYRYDARKRELFAYLAEVDAIPSFDQCIEWELAGGETHLISRLDLVGHGRYAEQLARYFERFPRDQIHVISHSDLLCNPLETLNEVVRFLDLPGYSWEAVVNESVNASPYEEEMSPRVRQTLTEYYKPHNEALYELMGRDFGW